MHMKRALHQDANIRPILQYCLRPVRDRPQEVGALKPWKLNYRIIKGLPGGLTPSCFQIKTVNKCFCCWLPTLALITHPSMSSGKGKGCPITCQWGTEVRYRYRCTHLWPWNGMGGQHDAFVILLPCNKPQYPSTTVPQYPSTTECQLNSTHFPFIFSVLTTSIKFSKMHIRNH
jgi:hypothetical protein